MGSFSEQVEFEFTVRCDVCGSDLDESTSTRRGVNEITVTPCNTCLDAARQQEREKKTGTT